jgi:hypothetical protein
VEDDDDVNKNVNAGAGVFPANVLGLDTHMREILGARN